MKDKKEQYNQEDKRRKYLNMVFSMFKKKESINFSSEKTYFNATEIRLMGEVLSAEYEGKRLISTRIADILGVTRSAVSQIVNKLEKDGVVKRVPDEVDRKIAYIEVTDEALERYGEDLKLCVEFVGDVVEKFGEERFLKMYGDIMEFMSLMQTEKGTIHLEEKVFLKSKA